MKNKFYRINQHASLGGVCGGLAYFLGIQAWIVKAVFVFGTIFTGIPIIIYIFCLFAPKFKEDPSNYEDVCK